MKKIIGYIGSYLLYYLGDLVSRSPFMRATWGYKLYSWAMRNSALIQDWAGNSKPWEHIETPHNSDVYKSN